MGFFDKLFEKKYCDLCGEKLGVFGGSYLYPVFRSFGVIAGDNDESNIRVN